MFDPGRLQHPDVILPVHGDPADLAHDPVVGQLFRVGVASTL